MRRGLLAAVVVLGVMVSGVGIAWGQQQYLRPAPFGIPSQPQNQHRKVVPPKREPRWKTSGGVESPGLVVREEFPESMRRMLDFEMHPDRPELARQKVPVVRDPRVTEGMARREVERTLGMPPVSVKQRVGWQEEAVWLLVPSREVRQAMRELQWVHHQRREEDMKKSFPIDPERHPSAEEIGEGTAGDERRWELVVTLKQSRVVRSEVRVPPLLELVELSRDVQSRLDRIGATEGITKEQCDAIMGREGLVGTEQQFGKQPKGTVIYYWCMPGLNVVQLTFVQGRLVQVAGSGDEVRPEDL